MAEKGKHTNKVVVNGETILDLTQDTVEPSSLLKGTTAHDKSGAQVTGTYEAPVTSVNSKTGAVVLSASDVGAQSTITANGFLKGDGSGNITADKPAFCVMIDKAQDGTITVNKTQEEIHEAYSSGYAVYADYGDWDWGTTLQVLVAKIRITIFAGVYIITDDSVVYIVVSNTGSGWVERMVVVPLADKVVPTIRTINSKPLSADITLNAADVNAVGLTGNQVITGNKEFNGGTTFRAITVVDVADFEGATVTGLSGLLPTVTASDNGKFLRVVNGAWAAATVENANGVSF